MEPECYLMSQLDHQDKNILQGHIFDNLNIIFWFFFFFFLNFEWVVKMFYFDGLEHPVNPKPCQSEP